MVHRIQRNQNHLFSDIFRVGNRSNPFANTLTILEDPAKHRKLYLIGSTHSSTLLANRTRKLIQDVRPDSVFVQCNAQWWETAKHIKDVSSQEEMNVYNDVLRKTYNWQIESGMRTFRNLVFWLRFYSWLAAVNCAKAFNSDFHPFLPGLEVKYALEEAEKLGANVVFGGMAIRNSDLQALKIETRFDPLNVTLNFVKTYLQTKWRRERADLFFASNVIGGEAFAESFDRYRAAWCVKFFERISPHQKRILIDKKDADLFTLLYKSVPGKNIVAVVNQWHMEGIENHWRHTTNTQINTEPINPIGDMDIEAYFEDQVVNDYLRIFTSRLTKSEPASARSYITQYYKDCQEYERFRHVEFLDHKDAHQYHGQPYEGGYQHHHPQLPPEVRQKIEGEWKKKFAHHDEHH